MKEYIDKIIEFSKLTVKENSLLFKMVVKDNLCNIEISLIDQQGNNKKLDNTTFEVNKEFYNYLAELVEKFYKENEIVTNDIVNLDKDELVTFRMITKYNDLFSVDGISREEAEVLNKIIKDIK